MLSPDRFAEFARLLDARLPTTTSCAAPSRYIRGTLARAARNRAIAHAAGVTPDELHHLFRRWAGLTPKAFLQALTLDSARELLRDFGERARRGLRGRPVRPRPAARSVRHPRGDVARRMEGRRRRPDHHLRLPSLPVRHGAGDGDASAGLRASRFADPGEGTRGARDMRARWPKAQLRRGHAQRTAPTARRIFDSVAVAPGPAAARRHDRHRFRGARLGNAARHSDGPAHRPIRTSPPKLGKPKAARAVGAAVGKNPISFVVPCHRVLGKSGDITGYHWGLTRKRAMLGWEAGMTAAA